MLMNLSTRGRKAFARAPDVCIYFVQDLSRYDLSRYKQVGHCKHVKRCYRYTIQVLLVHSRGCTNQMNGNRIRHVRNGAAFFWRLRGGEPSPSFADPAAFLATRRFGRGRLCARMWRCNDGGIHVGQPATRDGGQRLSRNGSHIEQRNSYAVQITK